MGKPTVDINTNTEVKNNKTLKTKHKRKSWNSWPEDDSPETLALKKQARNTIIWSVTGTIILLLLAVFIWIKLT